MKRIIINEKQKKVIVAYISESNNYDRILKSIVEDLDLNYEQAVGVNEIGNEFYNTPMIGKKVDGSNITPKALLDYFKHKYDVGRTFLKQVITDWYEGNFKKNNSLSKNVPLR
jgi:hypothetical protein